ncbi:BRO-N domain-containing protein [Salmonella enterica]|uniref:BRO-N domain-containing protein n=1 Tax=Salmonella enterica TaxID=28901 RepID=UPI003D316049
MNIVAKSVYNFHGVNLIPVKDVAGIWLTSADIAKALGYKSTKSISNLFTQYEDEFSQGMTMVIESVTNGINGSTRRMKVRVFSLRGAHLIAMFARTPVAKEFRRWVLDILDREVAQGRIYPAFAFDMYAHNARVANEHIRHIYNVWRENLSPALRGVGSPIARNLEDRFKAIGAITFGLANALSKQEKNGKIH